MAATTINLQAIEDSIIRAGQYLKEQEAALVDIDRVINSMEDAWESESQRVYVERFRAKRRKIEDFNHSFRAYLEHMRRFANECASIDGRAGLRLRSVKW